MAASDLAKAREYFEERVRETDRDKCWLWEGKAYEERYSIGGKPNIRTVAYLGGKLLPARTLSWILDGGMQSDGPFRVTCGNGLCVNPDHLEPCERSHKGRDSDFVSRLEYGFYLNSLSEDDDGE